MSGNIAEFLYDAWNYDKDNISWDNNSVDPLYNVFNSSDWRTWRGGHILTGENRCQINDRNPRSIFITGYDTGFRVVRRTGRSSSGGIVFYDAGEANITAKGWRYIEVAPPIGPQGAYGSNQYVWCTDANKSVSAGTEAGIGSGKFNTQKIIIQNNDGDYAAKKAAEFTTTYNGVTYNDWFLPSKDELQNIADSFNTNKTGVFHWDYWTSTESDDSKAFLYNADNGALSITSSPNVKYSTEVQYKRQVRPIRAFRSYTDNKPLYVVVYDKNGATSGEVPVDSYYYEAEQPVNIKGNTGSPILQKSGYNFTGWATQKDGGGTTYSPGSANMPALNLVLYAKWSTNTYTVTFNKQSGSGGTDSVTATYGSAMPTADAPTRNRYTFNGYWDAISGGNQYYNASMDSERNWDIISDTTLYARWTAIPYSITYNLNNGTNHGSNPTTYTTASAVTLQAPSRSGFTFDGWFDNSGFNGTKVTSILSGSTGNKTFWAKWLQNYTITFVSNGGTSVSSAVVPHGHKVTKPADPTLSGFTVQGWYTNSDLTTAWNFDTSTVTAPATLYAKWQSPATPTVTKATTTLTNTIDSVGVSGGTSILQGRTVNLSSFYIGKYEITYAQWWEVKTWAALRGYYFQNNGQGGSQGSEGMAPDSNTTNQPVTAISWRDAIVWCNALSEMENLNPCYTNSSNGTVLKSSSISDWHVVDNAVLNLSVNGYRLPTEAEWEYAARYEDGKNWTPADYASGATAGYTDAAATNQVAWYYLSDYSGSQRTQPVGDKNANLLGLFDMSGNVSELCSDRFEGFLTPSLILTNPTGPTGGESRVLRGGAFFDSADQLQVSFRNSSIQSGYTDTGVGFRVVKSAD